MPAGALTEGTLFWVLAERHQDGPAGVAARVWHDGCLYHHSHALPGVPVHRVLRRLAHVCGVSDCWPLLRGRKLLLGDLHGALTSVPPLPHYVCLTGLPHWCQSGERLRSLQPRSVCAGRVHLLPLIGGRAARIWRLLRGAPTSGNDAGLPLLAALCALPVAVAHP